MKRYIAAALFLAFALTAQGQSTSIGKVFQSNFKKAEEMYANLAYRNALGLYLAVVDKDSSNVVARQRVADCYFRLGEMAQAEQWYSSLAARADVPPLTKYQYAQVLAIQGKYALAQKWFSSYAAISGDKRAASKIEFLQHLGYYQRDSLLYTIKNEPYNSDQSDFAPQYYDDGVVFVSARDRDLFIKHQSTSALNEKESMLNVFFAPKLAAGERDAILFNNRDLNSTFHDGPIVFYDGNKRVAFSRNNLVAGKPVLNSGKVNLKLYFGELDAAKATKKVEPFDFNNDAFSIAHPSVTDDGRTLYFASNQPGGYGGVDLYRSVSINGKWTTPVNLGPNVNTMGDEFYPFLSNDSTLYFSSTGHGGLGGLDVYLCHLRNGVWSNPENPGAPLNSSADDFSLVMNPNGREGMFSSNRPGGIGYDDIYSFKVNSFSLVGRTVDRNNPAVAVSGATVTVADNAGQWTRTAVADADGYFYMDLAFDKSVRLFAEKSGYTCIDTMSYSTQTRTMGRDSITLPLWRHTLFAKGIVYSNESQDKLPDVTVTIKNISDNMVDSVITAPGGAYNFMLKPNKKYLISATKDGFIPREFELNTAGIMSGDLVNDMLLEEKFQEKVVVGFDFEKWDIKPESQPLLDVVARDMKRNKNTHLHISAYADSQGTHEFNLELSNKRAGELVRFLQSRGIDRARITAIGFGEELILNQCSNGVVCPDEEHAKNRRAELKVQ